MHTLTLTHIQSKLPYKMECQKQPEIFRLKPSAHKHTTHTPHIDDKEKVHNFHHHQCLSIWFFLDIYFVWWCYMVVVVAAVSRSFLICVYFAPLCSVLFCSVRLCCVCCMSACFVLVILPPLLYTKPTITNLFASPCVRICVCLCRYLCVCVRVCELYVYLLLGVETAFFNISPTSVCARVLYIMVLFFMVAAIFVDVTFTFFIESHIFFLSDALFRLVFWLFSLILSSFLCRAFVFGVFFLLSLETAYEMISEWTFRFDSIFRRKKETKTKFIGDIVWKVRDLLWNNACQNISKRVQVFFPARFGECRNLSTLWSYTERIRIQWCWSE